MKEVTFLLKNKEKTKYVESGLDFSFQILNVINRERCKLLLYQNVVNDLGSHPRACTYFHFSRSPALMLYNYFEANIFIFVTFFLIRDVAAVHQEDGRQTLMIECNL